MAQRCDEAGRGESVSESHDGGAAATTNPSKSYSADEVQGLVSSVIKESTSYCRACTCSKYTGKPEKFWIRVAQPRLGHPGEVYLCSGLLIEPRSSRESTSKRTPRSIDAWEFSMVVGGWSRMIATEEEAHDDWSKANSHERDHIALQYVLLIRTSRTYHSAV